MYYWVTMKYRSDYMRKEFVSKTHEKVGLKCARQDERHTDMGKPNCCVHWVRAAPWTLKTADKGFRNCHNLLEGFVLCQLRLPTWTSLPQTLILSKLPVVCFNRKRVTGLAAWNVGNQSSQDNALGCSEVCLLTENKRTNKNPRQSSHTNVSQE